MVTVRALTHEDDVEEAGHVYAESWKTSYQGILPEKFLDKLTADRWSAMLRAEPESTVALLDHKGAVLGAATVCFSREPGREGYGEIVSIYLRPAVVGRGYGRLLMEAALQKLRDDGCEAACLWAFERNKRAEGFYIHMGFRASGRTQKESFGGEMAELKEFVRSL